MAVLRRTCIGCHQVRARADLIRITRSFTNGAVTVDPRGKEKGRGAYVCPKMDCINSAVEPQRLNRAFRIVPGSADCVSLEAIDRLKQDLLELIEVQR